MEIQVENHGSNVDLKIVLVWFWLFHVGFQTWCQFFILKVMFICIYTFLNHKRFEKSLHACPYCFCIAKGLATFRLVDTFCALIISIKPIKVFRSTWYHLCHFEVIFCYFAGFCMQWPFDIEICTEP